eukprot:Gb_02859 [translate_table: standard]
MEGAARVVLRDVWRHGHEIMELTQDEKRVIFFCSLCSTQCYSDGALSDHLNGNLHARRKGSKPFHHHGENPNLHLRSGDVVKFEIRSLLDLIQRFKVNVAPVVPLIVRAITKNAMVEDYDLLSIRIFLSGATRLGKELDEAFRTWVPNALFGQVFKVVKSETSLGVKEGAAKVVLRDVWRHGHEIVELTQEGKRVIFFCSLCSTRCYNDGLLSDHLNGNLYARRKGSKPFHHHGENPNTYLRSEDVVKFEIRSLLDLIKRFKVNVALVVPLIMLAIAMNAMVEDYDLSSIRIVLPGIAPLGKEFCGIRG